MSQYRSNQKQPSQLSKKSSLNQSIIKQRHPKSRFAEARLLVLITKQIFNGKISSILDQLRTAPKRRYTTLDIFNSMLRYRMRQTFMQILRYGKHHALGEIQTTAKRVKIQIFLCRSLDKLYRKVVRNAFYRINAWQYLDHLNLMRLEYYLTNINSTVNKFNYRVTLRKIQSISQKRKLARVTIITVVNTIKNILTKHVKQSFQKLVLISSHELYEDRFNTSQKQRKIFYDCQSKKSQYLATERQNLNQLKITIDNYTYERNSKLGEIKIEKAMKINQVQQNIRALERQYKKSQLQFGRLERCLEKYGLVIQKRAKLAISSKGAQKKVHSLYNQLKYQPEEKNQLRSSSFINKIFLNKQKFKQILLINFQPFKAQNEDYQIYLNIIQRNLICAYENVPLDSIKLSQQYVLAYQENQGLKQFLSSLIFYDLLKQKGDQILKANSLELEYHFQNIFRFVQEQQNGERDEELRDSFISYRSSKTLKKKSSIRTSNISNKSLK